MKKYIIAAFLLGAAALCALNFMGFPLCANCSAPELWNGDCTSALAQNITDDCCVEVDMCGGFVDNPSMCYHQYCSITQEMCVPVENIEGQNYECKCASIYV